MKETALLILSGKILDRPFDLDALDEIRIAIEKSLSDRGVVVTRRCVTLSGERQIAAPFFLGAGFEAIPADDEDVQAAAAICASAFSASPPDEIVFMTGLDEPVNLLRSIAGRSRRTLLHLAYSDADVGVSDTLRRSLDCVIEIRDLLTKESVHWDSLNLRTWDEWVEQFEALLTGADEGSSPLMDQFERKGKSPTDEPEGPDVADDLILSPDIYEEFARTAPQWNKALEAFLLENNLKYSAFKATEYLDRGFPSLNEFYLSQPDEFRKLLGKNVRLVSEPEAEGGVFLYHVNHPYMKPVAASGALSNLAIGSASDDENDAQDVTTSDTPDSFAQIAKFADLMRRQCDWTVERQQLVSSGASYEESIEPFDQELEEEANRLKIYLWQRRMDDKLESEDFSILSELYDLLSKSLTLMDNVAQSDAPVKQALAVRAMQLLAKSQCLIKSGLIRFHIPFGYDRTQRNTFELLTEYRKANYPREFIYNMKKDDLLDFSERDKVLEEYEALDDEFHERVLLTKGRKECEGKLNYHLGQIRKNPTKPNINDWNTVVASTTELCEVHGERTSSILLRNYLSDLIDNIPEKVETTVTFGRVVQDIDLYKAQIEEELEREFEFATVERVVSPETQAVRNRYSGSKMVFIGGTPKDHVRERIEKAFDVELVWFETDHGDSLVRFDPFLRDPDVAAFLIYIPWCSHMHSEQFVACSKKSNKDFIRLPRGTNPEQIAQAICQQLKLLEEQEAQ